MAMSHSNGLSPGHVSSPAPCRPHAKTVIKPGRVVTSVARSKKHHALPAPSLPPPPTAGCQRTTVASPRRSPDHAPRPDESASILAPAPVDPSSSDTHVAATTGTVDDYDPRPFAHPPSHLRSRPHPPSPPPRPQPSRSDRCSLLENIAFCGARASSSLTGLIRIGGPLPSFPLCWQQAMASSKQYQVPQTPRVISPSPTPSDASARDGYFGPVTRSAARKNRGATSPPQIDEDSSSSDPEKRARARSRSPILEGGRRRRMSGLTSIKKPNGKKGELALPNGTVNGHLSPQAANKNYWRELSRSPSPLGLIPIHQKWRSFVSSLPSHFSLRSSANPKHRSTATKYPARSSTSPSASSLYSSIALAGSLNRYIPCSLLS